MNRSGLAVKHLTEYYRPEIRNIMVVHDDIDLDAGSIKIVRGGGAGGHHGVESVVYHLGTNGFNRIKIGIGRPRYNENVRRLLPGGRRLGGQRQAPPQGPG